MVAELAAKLVAKIPQPEGAPAVRRPLIKELITNVAEGPFGSGKIVRVGLQGEPGAVAAFDIGNFRKGLPMRETQPGVYLGEYAVLPGDSTRDMPIIAYLKRPSGPESQWIDTSGLVGLDGLRGTLRAPEVEVRLAGNTLVQAPELIIDVEATGTDLPGGAAPVQATLSGLRYDVDAGTGAVLWKASVKVEVPNNWFAEWLRSNYSVLIQDALRGQRVVGHGDGSQAKRDQGLPARADDDIGIIE